MTIKIKILIGILIIVILASGWWIWNKQKIGITYKTESVTITTDKTKYNQGEEIKLTIKNDLDKSIWYEDYSTINYSFLGIEKFEKGKWEPLIKFKFDEEERTFPIAKFDFPVKGEYWIAKEKEGMCCASEGGWRNCYGVADRLPYDTKELKPNSEILYEWNQKICPREKVKIARLGARPFQPVYFEPEFIWKGHYRFVFEYGLSIEEFPGSVMPEFAGGTLVKDKQTIYSNEFTVK